MIQQFCFWLDIQRQHGWTMRTLCQGTRMLSLSHICPLRPQYFVCSLSTHPSIHSSPPGSMSMDVSQSQKDIYHRIPHILIGYLIGYLRYLEWSNSQRQKSRVVVDQGLGDGRTRTCFMGLDFRFVKRKVFCRLVAQQSAQHYDSLKKIVKMAILR